MPGLALRFPNAGRMASKARPTAQMPAIGNGVAVESQRQRPDALLENLFEKTMPSATKTAGEMMTPLLRCLLDTGYQPLQRLPLLEPSQSNPLLVLRKTTLR